MIPGIVTHGFFDGIPALVTDGFLGGPGQGPPPPHHGPKVHIVTNTFAHVDVESVTK